MGISTFQNQNINQFAQLPTLGELDLRLNTQNLAVRLDPNYAGAAITPGTAVKLVASTGLGIAVVTPCTVNSDVIYGFVNYDPKLNLYTGGMYMTISFNWGNVMYMNASATFDRNVQLGIVVASTTVVTATTGMTVFGWSIDQATAVSQLVRVMIAIDPTRATHA